MYSEKFLTLTKQLLNFEGGKVDNLKDHGGRTAYGITQKNYDSYRHLRTLSIQDVFLITHDEVLEIYFRSYYTPLLIDAMTLLPSSYIIYDFSVNSGIKKAYKLKMDSLNPIYLLDKREEFYYFICNKRPEDRIFLKGWINRLVSISKIYQLDWKPKICNNL